MGRVLCLKLVFLSQNMRYFENRTLRETSFFGNLAMVFVAIKNRHPRLIFNIKHVREEERH